MPESGYRLDYGRTFSPKETRRITLGVIPEDMDDRWFAFYEPPWFHLHRSWSGFEVYRLRLEETKGGLRVAECWVNDDPEQYRRAESDAEERERLGGVLSHVVLAA